MTTSLAPDAVALRAVVGQTIELVLDLTDDATAPLDLSDKTVAARIGAASGGAALASATLAVAGSQVTITWTAAQTAALKPGQYGYAVFLTWADGAVSIVRHGRLILDPAPTSAA